MHTLYELKLIIYISIDGVTLQANLMLSKYLPNFDGSYEFLSKFKSFQTSW